MAEKLTSSFAPYAPVRNVLEVIRRRRERGLPDPVTVQVLESIGIPAGNASRTLQALRFLRLVDDEGRQTPLFEELARAPSSEYGKVLTEILRSAYRAIFAIVDPAQDPDDSIGDAFRQFEPAAQRSRMVTLFLGLCEAAGIVTKKRGHPSAVPSGRRVKVGTSVRSVGRGPIEGREPEQAQGLSDQRTLNAGDKSIDYRLISALIQHLPLDGRWSADKREKWLQAVRAAVDLLVEVTDKKDGEATSDHSASPSDR